ncbi:hypothetical protein A0H81_14831 [Grifola frondosa]|uniref:Uncharacterized protein n=1 Tax=Grifola frondosa TaxID=5627 RepID=A0A1C7LKH0_GRIFR|nr:hypothetical protein A0H81_14831 [Grifola frondosa]
MPELWYFTPEAQREAAEFHHAIAEEAFGLSQTEEGLALKPLASFRPSKKVIPDHLLTWEQFTSSKPCLLEEMAAAGWGRRNVEAYSGFYWLLETHDLRSETWGTQVLLLYHARIRRSWHDAITAKKDIFNISIMSEQVLQRATDDVMNSMRLDSVSKASTRPFVVYSTTPDSFLPTFLYLIHNLSSCEMRLSLASPLHVLRVVSLRVRVMCPRCVSALRLRVAFPRPTHHPASTRSRAAVLKLPPRSCDCR